MSSKKHKSSKKKQEDELKEDEKYQWGWIACGPTHTLAISNDGSLKGWGFNDYGQLGKIASSKTFDRPSNIEMIYEGKIWIAVQVACGMKHSVVLANVIEEDEERGKMVTDEVLFCTGYPENGRLGFDLLDFEGPGRPLENQINLKMFYPLLSLRNAKIKQIACGSSFTMALTQNGKIYAWGEGKSGGLGMGGDQDVLAPKEIIFFDNIKVTQIACGASHAGAITGEGDLYMWGGGELGQLGVEPPKNANSPVKTSIPAKLICLALGTYHSAAISLDGNLFVWGGNKNGQLGTGDFTTRYTPERHQFFTVRPVAHVSCGPTHTIVVTVTGKVFTFGSNLNARCGFGPPDLNSNIEIPTELSFYDTSEDKVTQVACSLNHSLALSKEGTLYTWGKNKAELIGRIIEEDFPDEEDDENAGDGIKSDVGGERSEGSDNNFDDEEKNKKGGKERGYALPQRIENETFKKDTKAHKEEISHSVKSVACGLFHSMVLTNAGELYVWGSNACGQHGVSTKTLIERYEGQKRKDDPSKLIDLTIETLPTLIIKFDIKINRKVTLIASGAEHIFAVENGRKVHAWGRNSEGQLGIGRVCPFVEEPTPIQELLDLEIMQIVASEEHSIVLTKKGHVYSFGSPTYGRLGLGIASSLQIHPKKIPVLENVIQIACGPSHSMALVHIKDKNLKIIYSWGSGWNGKLGNGGYDNSYEPVKVDSQIQFKYISCGSNHSAALSERKGELYGWGSKESFGIYDFIKDAFEDDKTEVEECYLTPTLIHTAEEASFESIILGSKINMAITSTGHIYKWGMFESVYDEDFKKKENSIKNSKDKKGKLTELEKQKLRRQIYESSKGTYNVAAVFQEISLSTNHAIGRSGKNAYTWGIDHNTGRLGLNFEIFFKLEDKKSKKRNESAEKMVKPAYLHDVTDPKQVNFLAVIFAINQSVQREERATKSKMNNNDGGGGADGNASDGKSTISKKAGDNRSRVSAKSKMSNKSKMSKMSKKKKGMKSVAGAPEHDEDEQEDNLAGLLTQFEQDGKEKKMIEQMKDIDGLLKQIFEEFDELKDKNNKIKAFIHEMKGEIITRISSKPFNIAIINRKITHLPKEFLENKDIYSALLTLFQLHPCYLLNIYCSEGASLHTVFEIIKDIYGDLHNDRRKTRLFIILCLLVLDEELKKNVNDYKELDLGELEEGRQNTTPLFSRLVLHLVQSHPDNLLYFKLVLNTIRREVEKLISNKSNKFQKQYALVFTGEGLAEIRKKIAAESESSKKKTMLEKIEDVRNVVLTIITDISKQKLEMGKTQIDATKAPKNLRKEVKYVLIKAVDKIVSAFKEAASQFEILQSKATALIFTPLLMKVEKSKKLTEYKANYLSTVECLIKFIKGEIYKTVKDDEEWLTVLNSEIMRAEEIRYEINTKFHKLEPKPYDFDRKILGDAFFHSLDFLNDRITCKVSTLANLTEIIHKNKEKINIVLPVELDVTYFFLSNLHEKFNYITKSPTSQEADLKVNIKLKTRQLMYSDNKSFSVCPKCGVILKSFMLGADSKPLIERYEIDDVRCLRAIYKDFLLALPEISRQDLLNPNDDFETFLKKVEGPWKAQAKADCLQILEDFKVSVEIEIQNQINKDGGPRKKLTNDQKSEAKFELVSRIHDDLKERVEYIEKYERDLNNIKGFFENRYRFNMNDNKRVKRIRKLEGSTRVLEQIRLGASVIDKRLNDALTKNRKSMYSQIKSNINISPQCKDLIENLNEAEKRRLGLFGEYSLPILKLKKILVEYKLATARELPSYSIIVFKKGKNYIFNLVYTNRKQGFFANLLRKPSFNEYDEIIEQHSISEDKITRYRQLVKKDQNEKNKTGQNEEEGEETAKKKQIQQELKITLGENLILRVPNLLDLIDALENNYQIYAHQITKRKIENGEYSNVRQKIEEKEIDAFEKMAQE